MQKSHVAYNQRKYAPAVCARRSPACMRGIVSHRSTACMRDGLVCTKPAGFFGFYPRRACMRSRLLSATLRYIFPNLLVACGVCPVPLLNSG